MNDRWRKLQERVRNTGRKPKVELPAGHREAPEEPLILNRAQRRALPPDPFRAIQRKREAPFRRAFKGICTRRDAYRAYGDAQRRWARESA